MLNIIEKMGGEPNSPTFHKAQSNKMEKLTENAFFFGFIVFFF